MHILLIFVDVSKLSDRGGIFGASNKSLYTEVTCWQILFQGQEIKAYLMIKMSCLCPPKNSSYKETLVTIHINFCIVLMVVRKVSALISCNQECFMRKMRFNLLENFLLNFFFFIVLISILFSSFSWLNISHSIWFLR